MRLSLSPSKGGKEKMREKRKEEKERNPDADVLPVPNLSRPGRISLPLGPRRCIDFLFFDGAKKPKGKKRDYGCTWKSR
jgi:hypothetical protein